MASRIDTTFIACCGLDCGECGIGNGQVQRAARDLDAMLTGLGYPQWVPTLAEQVPAAGYYSQFDAMLKWLGEHSCPGCRCGGGAQDCAVRACCADRGFVGCWQCELETCELLAPFDRDHPEMIAERRRIALIGLENWIDERRMGT